MGLYEQQFAIRLLAINQNSFTDIVGTSVLPIDCNYVMVLNDTGQDIFLRSDPGNANSQVTIHDGQMFTIGVPGSSPNLRVRFPKGLGAPVGSLESATGAVNATILSIL